MEHVAGVDAVVPHEALDRQISGSALDRAVAEALGDLLLIVEAHLIVLPIREQVEFVSDAPEKIQRRKIGVHLAFGEQPEVEEVFAPPRAGLGSLHRPIGGVEIAQSSRALLDVRLQEVEGFPELAVALLHGLDQLRDEPHRP